MKNCELLSCVSVNAGVAAESAYDLIRFVLASGEILKAEHFNKVREIDERLQTALCAVNELQNRINRTKPQDDYYEAEQPQLIKPT